MEYDLERVFLNWCIMTDEGIIIDSYENYDEAFQEYQQLLYKQLDLDVDEFDEFCDEGEDE